MRRPLKHLALAAIVCLGGALASGGCSHRAPDVKVSKAPQSSTPFCVRAVRYVNQFNDTFAVAGGDGSALLSESSIGKLWDSLNRLQPVAPDGLRADVVLVRQGFGTYRAVLQRYDFEIDRIPVDERTLTDPAVLAANDRVEKYLEKDCGIHPDTAT